MSKLEPMKNLYIEIDEDGDLVWTSFEDADRAREWADANDDKQRLIVRVPNNPDANMSVESYS